LDDVFGYIDAQADRYVATLQRLVRQRSVAAQNDGMGETAALVEGLLRDLGADARQVETRGGYPVVYGELAGGGSKTLSFYNHYDVQPADPLDLWQSDPWGAEIRDGRIGGGASPTTRGTSPPAWPRWTPGGRCGGICRCG
jgi:acetylornithine deacetylase/succinyl-diaminopimelate desuccinylase-like protein